MWICMWISMWIWWFHVPNAGSWGLLQRQQTPAATGGDHPALQRGAKCWKHWKQLCNRRMSGWPVDQLWPVWLPCFTRLMTLNFIAKSCQICLHRLVVLLKIVEDMKWWGCSDNFVQHDSLFRQSKTWKTFTESCVLPVFPSAFAGFHQHVSQAQEEYEEKKAECAAQVLIRV